MYITHGGRGGSAKTTSMIALADTLVKMGKDFAAVDCDTENNGKSSSFGSYLKAELLDLRSTEECDRLLDIASQNSITLVDLPANAGGDILPWVETAFEPSVLEAYDVDVTFLLSITPESGAFASAMQWVDSLQDLVDYIVVLNRKVATRTRLPSERVFPEYFGTATGREFRKVFAPREVEIEGLVAGSMSAWAKKPALPSAIESDPNFPVLDRARINAWIKKIRPQFERALA